MPDLITHSETAPHLMNLIPRPDVVMSHGRGSWVYDEQGNEYLDFVQGWAVNALGHAPPELARVLSAQGARLLSVSPAYYTRELMSLSAALCTTTGLDRVFLTGSGAEANDAAIKLARKWAQVHRPGANRIITARDGFHGRTLACVSASGKPGWDSSFPPMLDGFDRAPFGDAHAVEQLIDERTCAVMVEPIQGEAGVIVPPAGYLEQLRDVTLRCGVLLIFDEVQTGWGRTGENFWGFQAHGVTPDILTFAKGLGNGLAIAGVVARGDIMDCLGANSISTFGGNPLSTAGALANLNYLLERDLQANAFKMGGQLREGLDAISAEVPEMLEVRGKGLMIGVELGTDAGEPDAALTTRVMEEAKAGKLLIGKGGLYGNSLRIAPPLTVTADEVAEGLDILGSALKRATGG